MYTITWQLLRWPTPIDAVNVYENEIRTSQNVYDKWICSAPAPANPYTLPPLRTVFNREIQSYERFNELEHGQQQDTSNQRVYNRLHRCREVREKSKIVI
ncbi:hypothetical protein EHV15_36210 [Paenibacillus oralis]|uniref:Uncharacterized protein n=1 Tax=Paenibacillus oralis TaxID=2490856 RepID=A0A3P3T7K7_9BACL|nr:hypothetical protein [Paenibacillus oralis]RRJ54007.1 hypothetical protein EHV15_36210 [Paenibacillus oralis]